MTSVFFLNIDYKSPCIYGSLPYCVLFVFVHNKRHLMLITKKVSVFGGSGFIGSCVVQHLADAGYLIDVITRSKRKCARLLVAGYVGQVRVHNINIDDTKSLEDIIESSDFIVNCIGVPPHIDASADNMTKLHITFPSLISKCCSNANKKLIHISSLFASYSNDSRARYALIREEGDKIVLNNCNATILRLSLVFGQEDTFFNRIAMMANTMRMIITYGKTVETAKIQPIYVGDVAASILSIINKNNTSNGVYELGGKSTYTNRFFYHMILNACGISKDRVISIPKFLMSLICSSMNIIPRSFRVITHDQMKMFSTDSIVKSDLNIETLGLNTVNTMKTLKEQLTRYDLNNSLRYRGRILSENYYPCSQK